jgi:RIO kinase 1
MKTPKRLHPLLEDGLIDTVVRQLMSGKEAMVFVVRRGGETLCAKVYKEADRRSFRQAVDYTENRKTKNSRRARAIWRRPPACAASSRRICNKLSGMSPFRRLVR